MDIQCTDQELFIFNQVAEAAEQLGVETYLIGGFVRDKLLSRPSTDADIVCVGDGIELAKAVARKFHPAPQVNYFKNFGTAQIKVNLAPNSIEGTSAHHFDIEFIGARKESYRDQFPKARCNPVLSKMTRTAAILPSMRWRSV